MTPITKQRKTSLETPLVYNKRYSSYALPAKSFSSLLQKPLQNPGQEKTKDYDKTPHKTFIEPNETTLKNKTTMKHCKTKPTKQSTAMETP